MLTPEQAAIVLFTVIAITFLGIFLHCLKLVLAVASTFPSRNLKGFLQAIPIALLPDNSSETPSNWHY